MMSLLGGEVAALLPGLTGTTPAEAGASAAPQAFAEVLSTELESLGTPDAAVLALLSQQQVAMLTPTATGVPIIPTTATLATDALGGKSLPLHGSDVPLIHQQLLQKYSANPNTTAPPDFLLQDDAEWFRLADDKTAFSAAPISTTPLIPISTAVPAATAAEPIDTEIERPVLRMDSAVVVANTSDGMARRENSSNGNGSNESAAHTEQKMQVMQSLSALSNAISPFNGGTTGARHDREATTLLPSFARAVESISITPDSGGVASAGLSAPVSSSLAPKGELSIAQSPQQPGWGDAFGERVSFMVKQNLQQAEIRLNPPHLGQIDVRISMTGDQASLIISSPHASVRDAIESSMVRLRELLGESGISLANVDVSDKSFAQQHQGAAADRDSSGSQFWKGYRAEFTLDENAGEILGASGHGHIDYFV